MTMKRTTTISVMAAAVVMLGGLLAASADARSDGTRFQAFASAEQESGPASGTSARARDDRLRPLTSVKRGSTSGC